MEIKKNDKVDLRAWLWDKGIKATTITDAGANAIREWKSYNPENIKHKQMATAFVSGIIGIVIGCFI